MPGADGHAHPATSSARRSAGAKPQTMTVADSHRILLAEESDKLLDQGRVVREASNRPSRTHRLSRRDRQDLRPNRS
jgi:hypothetical protein